MIGAEAGLAIGGSVETVTAGEGAEAASTTTAAGAVAADGGACGLADGVDSAMCACTSRGGETTGGFTTTATGGGTTATIGRGGTAPAGALAITGPTGGLLAMARVAGGVVTMGGACLTGGIIFLGSGRAGAVVAGGAAATVDAGLAGVAGAAIGVGRTGVGGLLAPASSSCFLARIAFITSPGLETCDRSILGAIDCAPREEPA
jgi:hypothetical protein